MRTLTVDVVGAGLRSVTMPMSRSVKGTIQIETGNPELDERVWRIFQQASRDAAALLGYQARVDVGHG